MLGIKQRGKLLPFTFAETADEVLRKFREAITKAGERLGDKVNETPEAFNDRHSHICDLTKQTFKGDR